MATYNGYVIRRTVSNKSDLYTGALQLARGQWGYATTDRLMVLRDLSGNFHEIANLDLQEDTFVLKSGDIMTGSLYVQPTSNNAEIAGNSGGGSFSMRSNIGNGVAVIGAGSKTESGFTASFGAICEPLKSTIAVQANGDGGFEDVNKIEIVESIAEGALVKVYKGSNSVSTDFSFDSIGGVLATQEWTVEPTKSGTGFEMPEDTLVSYDYGTRKVSTSGTGSSLFYRHGLVKDATAWTGEARPVGNGAWFYHYDNGTFQWSQTPWLFYDAPIAFGYLGTACEIWLRECHGSSRNWVDHRDEHQARGTYKSAGGDFSSFTLGSTTATNRRPQISSTTIWDEDVPTILSALTTNAYAWFWLTGANTVNITVDNAEIIPQTGNVPRSNVFSTTWSLVDFTNLHYGKIFVVAIPVADDATSQKERYLLIAPQQTNSNLSVIQSVSPDSINLGELQNVLPEFNFIGEFIIRLQSGNWTLTSVSKITGNRFTQSTTGAGFLSTVATDGTTIIGDGTGANPLSVNPVLALVSASASLSINRGATNQSSSISDTSISFTRDALGSPSTASYSSSYTGGRASSVITSGSNTVTHEASINGVLGVLSGSFSNDHLLKINTSDGSIVSAGLASQFIDTSSTAQTKDGNIRSKSGFSGVSSTGTVVAFATVSGLSGNINITVNEATVNGAFTANGNVTLGDTSSDVITINGTTNFPNATSSSTALQIGGGTKLFESSGYLRFYRESALAGLQIVGGTSHPSYLEFLSNNGSANMGYVGRGSGANNNVTLEATLGNLALHSVTGLVTVPYATSSSTALQIGNVKVMGIGTNAGYFRVENPTVGVNNGFEIDVDANGTVYLQSFNRTALTHTPLVIDASSINFSRAISSATALQIGGGTKLWYANSLLNFDTRFVAPSGTPASASATGILGTWSWDASYIYICTATNTWKRVAIATW